MDHKRHPVVPLLLLAASLGFATAAKAGIIEDNLAAYRGETAEGYLRPLSEGLGQSLNTGFFTTAQIPKDGVHVRLELQLMSVFFEDGDGVFLAKANDEFENQDETEVSTVVGPLTGTTLEGDSGTGYAFPGGLDLGSVSLVMPQITVGSVVGTEATLRWIAIDSGSTDVGKINLIGFGVRHSISQWFDWNFDVAASAFYQKITAGDQDLMDGNALSLGGQVSKTFGMFEPFGSVTWDSWKMTASWTAFAETPSQEDQTIDFQTDTNLHFLAGAGIRVSVLRFYGAVNFAQRVGISAGLSVGS